MSGMNLTDFLLARIAEDEAVARSATRGPWVQQTGAMNLVYGDPDHEQSGGYVCDTGIPTVAGVMDDAEHITRWNPARVLAECAAKRRIIAAYRDADFHYTAETALDAHDYGDDGPQYFAEVFEQWAMAARLLAAPYSDHPDFDPAWRVDLGGKP